MITGGGKSRSPSDDRWGAYGLHLAGLSDARDFLVLAPASWPTVEVIRIVSDRPSDETDGIGEYRSVLMLPGGGSIVLERGPRRVVVTTAAPLDLSALAHPYLTPVGTMFARWDGRESFHAGGIVVDGGVWGLVGERGAGKSSLVGMWTEAGGEGFCDDVLVVAAGMAMAGPRIVDLDDAAAAHLGVSDQVATVPGRGKSRRLLGPVAAELPLLGWILLEWSDLLTCERLSVFETLPRLSSHRSILLRPDLPRLLLEAAALPAYRLARPREWGALAATVDLLLEVTRSAEA